MVYGLTMDEALTRHVGEFGWGQLKFLLMASVLLIPNAMACLLWVFIATDPVKSKSWECTAGPYAAACEEALASSSPEQAFCSLPAGAWQWADATSAVAQFDLVCSRKWLSQLANVFFFIGCFIGAGVFGRMCDVVGRKLPLLVSTLLVAASVLVSLASTNFWMFVGLRVGAGAGAAGQTLAIFLLSTEPAGPSWRGLANIISLVIFCLGEFVLVLVAYLLPRWQHIVLASGVANLAGLLFYPFVMESPRWLLSTGKQEAATQLLQKLCDNNHTRMPSQPLVAHTSTDGVQPSLLAVLRRPQILHRFFVLALLWFAAMAAYYGISLGAGGIPGSVHMVFALGAAAELVAVGVAALMVDRAGRHGTIAAGMLLCGVVSVACAVTHNNALQAAFATLGKFGCSVCLSIVGIYNAELFPTTIRSTIMGLHGQFSRLGCITAPFLLMAGQQTASSTVGPFLVFGSLALVGGLLMLTMPETRGTAMPETMEDLDAIQSVFTARPWRQGLWATLAFMARTSALRMTAGGVADGLHPEDEEEQGGVVTSSGPRWRGPSLDDVEACFGSDVGRGAVASHVKAAPPSDAYSIEADCGPGALDLESSSTGTAPLEHSRGPPVGEQPPITAPNGNAGPPSRLVVHVYVGEEQMGSPGHDSPCAGSADGPSGTSSD